jgi:formylglycine-generating enzyme required for sulfatase activity/DNA polymerase III delta prime subunit
MSRRKYPFKFLDSYQKEDIEIFFGREEETEELFEALSGVKHLLVYGPSGAGKTSLIECGLRNQFSDADWYALTIRRGHNMTASVFEEINQALEQPIPLDPATGLPIDAETDFGEAIDALFSERFQPVYLLFDQFEELLISGKEEEKRDFFARLNRLIRYKVPCRVLLILREEFIGHLSEFEQLCPTLFQNRFRLEKMRRAKVLEVILKMLEAPRYRSFFEVANSTALAQAILARLPDQRQEIELAHVQVFLSELWDRADTGEGKPLLHEALVKETDNLETVLDSFLKKQLSALEAKYGSNVPLEVLAAMISERHTKLQVKQSGLEKELAEKKVVLEQPLTELLRDFIRNKIVRQIKSGKEEQYEISHDVLALVVGQNLTEEIRMRDKAEEVYRVYLERKGLLTKEDIDFLRPFAAFKAIPAALAARISESERHWEQIELEEANRLKEEQARKLKETEERVLQEQKLREEAESQRNLAEDKTKVARQRTRFAFLLAFLTILGGIIALRQYFEANRLTQQTEAQNIQIQQQNEELGENNRMLENLLDSEKAARELAIENEEKAKAATLEAEESAAQAERARNEAQAERDRAEELSQEAGEARDSVLLLYDNLKDNRERELDNLHDEASLRILEGKYSEAYEKTNKAISIGGESPRFEALLGEIQAAMIKEAEQFVLVMDYELAFKKCKEAILVNGINTEIELLLQEVAYFHLEADLVNEALNALNTLEVAGSLEDKSTEGLMALVAEIDHPNFNLLEKRYYPEMVAIAGGYFIMGCAPPRDIGIDCNGSELILVEKFEIAKTETTQWQYALFLASRGDTSRLNSLQEGYLPVNNVTGLDAMEYCNWLSRKKKKTPVYEISFQDQGEEELEVEWNYSIPGYRLPLSTEWEYSARGGRMSANFQFSGGDDLDTVGWFSGNAGEMPHEVGVLQPNELGLYDMSGNVEEYCIPSWTSSKAEKGNILVRGGSFLGNTSTCYLFSEYSRDFLQTSYLSGKGFRVCF